MEQKNAYQPVAAYQLGDGLGNKASSFFTPGGREQSAKESELLRSQSLAKIARGGYDNDSSRSSSQDHLQSQLEQFVQESQAKERQSRKFAADLDEAKEHLRRSAEAGFAHFYEGPNFDTLHPKMLGLGMSSETSNARAAAVR